MGATEVSDKIIAKRDISDYRAHGKNCSYSIKADDCQLAFRKGRTDAGEAVEIEGSVWKFAKNGRCNSMYLTLSLSPELWAAIVEHVKENRELPRPTMKEQFTGLVEYEKRTARLSQQGLT